MKTVTVRLRVSPEEGLEWKRIALERGLSLSELIREAMLGVATRGVVATETITTLHPPVKVVATDVATNVTTGGKGEIWKAKEELDGLLMDAAEVSAFKIFKGAVSGKSAAQEAIEKCEAIKMGEVAETVLESDYGFIEEFCSRDFDVQFSSEEISELRSEANRIAKEAGCSVDFNNRYFYKIDGGERKKIGSW
jgi:hypothetical protein